MDLLTEYSLFLAKGITITVLLLVILRAFIPSKKDEAETSSFDKIKLSVSHLNAGYEKRGNLIQKLLLDEKELKKQAKEKNKQEKKDKKQGKQEKEDKKCVYIIDFKGDLQASEAEGLAQIISTIITAAKADDEVVLRLESPGGAVPNYGYAASQLARLREKELNLTVCIDKIAASGGYMMACVANQVIAAPFAVVGSIGVVLQLPNFNRLLKKHDIDYELLTAGKHKRSLTLFGENDSEGRDKAREDIERVHQLFQAMVTEYRPQVDLSEVATGDFWLGKDALNLKLVDRICTSDDYLFQLKEKFDLYHVQALQKKELLQRLFKS